MTTKKWAGVVVAAETLFEEPTLYSVKRRLIEKIGGSVSIENGLTKLAGALQTKVVIKNREGKPLVFGYGEQPFQALDRALKRLEELPLKNSKLPEVVAPVAAEDAGSSRTRSEITKVRKIEPVRHSFSTSMADPYFRQGRTWFDRMGSEEAFGPPSDCDSPRGARGLY